MHERIKRVVLESGLWSGGRESSHGFVLSPSVYEVSGERRDELQAIGAALHDCLGGLGRIAAIAFNPQLGRSNVWGMIGRALRTGVPEIYRDLVQFKPGKVPSICKVDIMESEDGSFRIAEIDGHNKHGLGYSTLAARIRRAVMPSAEIFPGVSEALARETRRHGEESVVLLYADQERFYLPEFCVLRDELATLGIELIVVAENDVWVEDGRVLLADDDREHKLFVDFPFMYYNLKLNKALAELFRDGKVDFLIPPKPFFGSKAVLAFLRNDLANEEIEGILRSQIPISSLELLRRYIPETYLIHKGREEEYWRGLCGERRFVLKEAISSGMKGVVFSDEPYFGAVMERACGSYYRFILQEEVINRSRSFQYFTDNGELLRDEWFLRITVHYSVRRIADVVVTARRDRKVHGATDCLQLGAVIV